MQAFLLIGSEKKQKEYLARFRGENSIPSYLVLTYDSFKISDARALKKAISLKLAENEKRLITISAPTPESQQALLKTVEELSLQNYLFFLAKSLEDVLPTIQSRCQTIFLDNEKLSIDLSLEEKIKNIIEKKSLGDMGDFLDPTIELSSIEQIILVLRKLILEDKVEKGQKLKLFKVLKILQVNYRLAKNNNINKKMALETSFLEGVN